MEESSCYVKWLKIPFGTEEWGEV